MPRVPAGNTPLPVEQFGGLRLDVDASEAGWGNAIDLRNVDLDRHGRVHSRMGAEQFTVSTEAAPYTAFWSYRGVTDRLIAGYNGATRALDSTGTIVTGTGHLGSALSAASVGTTNQMEMYIAYSTSTDMRVFDGTNFAAPTATVDGVPSLAMPSVQVLGVTPWDNRLIAANSETPTGGPGGGASSYYHVFFSQPGAPTVWDSSDYVILTPGDGEGITALVQWREYVFAFKRSKFFVFYGTSTDNTGGAIFQYRPVRAGVGVNANWQVCAARDGVYFADATGVYKTTGGDPQLISQAIAPVFGGVAGAPVTSFTGVTDVQVAALSAFENRLFLQVASGHTFVYDIDTGLWTYWEVVGGLGFQGTAQGGPQMCKHAFGANRPLMYFAMSSSNNAGRFNKSATADFGSGFSSFYQGGFAAPGRPGVEATIRETLVEGAGNVTLSWLRDYGSTQQASATVALGSQGRALHRKAVAGENLAYRLANADTSPWQANRLTPFLREARGAAELTR